MGDYEIDGESCWFVSHERMLEGLENNEFLDVGEHDNYLFGTTFESVRNIMAENKLCILDVRPEVHKQLPKHVSHPFYWARLKLFRGSVNLLWPVTISRTVDIFFRL